jgi:hypothetical protein
MTTKVRMRPLLRGTIINASYTEQTIREFQRHPLIEAIPDRRDTRLMAQKQGHMPIYSDAERLLPAYDRHELLYNTRRFVQPLPIYIYLATAVNRTVRWGYVGRNPVDPRQRRGILEAVSVKTFLEEDLPAPAASQGSFYIMGPPGTGKSTAVERTLLLFPQVILHREYAGERLTAAQLVWLKLDCPNDGSVRALCISAFRAIDGLLHTNFEMLHVRSGATADVLLQNLKVVVAEVNLGLWVIDEIHNLNQAASGGEARLLNFFVELMNTIGVPVILIGTLAAKELLTQDFRIARRGTGQGDFIWERLKYDETWKLFAHGLWKYQYTSHPTTLTDELSMALYSASQGIADMACKIYMLAQSRAIVLGGEEKLSADLFYSVLADSLRLTHPALKALRRSLNGTAPGSSAHDLVLSDDLVDLILADARKASGVLAELRSLSVQPSTITPSIEAVLHLKSKGIPEEIAFGAVKKAIESLGDRATSQDLLAVAARVAETEFAQSQQHIKRKKKRPNVGGLQIPTLAAQQASDAHSSLKAADIVRDLLDVLDDATQSAL